jgi:ELWxxDGT repeat protein
VEQPPFPPLSVGPQPGTATEIPGVGPGMGSSPGLSPTSQIGLTPFPLPVTRTYFNGDLNGVPQLWQADETITASPGESSTVSFSVNDVRPVAVISGHANPIDLTPVGGTPVGGTSTGSSELFTAADSRHGYELWISDGWSTNTHMVRDINPGPANSQPSDITVIGQTAYFSAFSPGHGIELWKVTVPPSPQMFVLGPQSAVKTGAKVRLTATMQPAPKAPRPTGTVTFYEGGSKIGTATLKRQASGGPTASLTITARAGNHRIVAVYSGDGHYLPATSNSFLVTGT